MLCEERRRLMDEWEAHKLEWERLASELNEGWDSSGSIPQIRLRLLTRRSRTKTKLTLLIRNTSRNTAVWDTVQHMREHGCESLGAGGSMLGALILLGVWAVGFAWFQRRRSTQQRETRRRFMLDEYRRTRSGDERLLARIACPARVRS